jgi:hypothetical protein
LGTEDKHNQVEAIDEGNQEVRVQNTMGGPAASFSRLFLPPNGPRMAYRDWKILQSVFRMNAARRESVDWQPLLAAVCRLASCAYVGLLCDALYEAQRKRADD